MDSGTRLGPYELLARVGQGGMGEVWKARDPRLDRIVAIKRLHTTDPERFAREARTIAALNHPHICQIHDVGPDYLVLEFIDGKPLHGPLSFDAALELARQIAGAVDAAHVRGILHRDLKPANILVSQAAPLIVKLLDFGLADVIRDDDVTRTAPAMVAGTIPYMSPEQLEGRPLDQRSDIFSFGAVLYELLSGGRAFTGESLAQVCDSIRSSEPAPLPSAARGLIPVVKRCLEKQPDRRFATMAEVRKALDLLATPAPPEAARPSIAVLPFANLSADPENEYFGDGLAEEILNALARVPGLRVIARTSAFAFKGRNEDIRRIADALDVTSVVEGSVRRAGNRIRVTAQLIQASDGSHLWSDRYDRELADVFAVQDDIAQAITGALAPRLTGSDTAVRRHLPDLAAYDEYLRARFAFQRLSPQALPIFRTHIENAIRIDPDFASAHTLLGLYYVQAGFMSGGSVPPREASEKARTAALKALQIDPTLSEAHALLGMVCALYDWEWDEAKRHFESALAQESVTPLARNWYGYFFLMAHGEFEESIVQHRLALVDDPLHPILRYGLAVSLLGAGRDAEAEDEVQTIQALDPQLPWVHGCLAALAFAKGDLDGMWDHWLRLYSLGSQAIAAEFQGLIHAMELARAGDVQGAEAVLATFNTLPGASGALSIYYSFTGDIERTADHIEVCIREHDPWAFFQMFTSSNPRFRLLRASPRWPGLLRLMRLPEWSRPSSS